VCYRDWCAALAATAGAVHHVAPVGFGMAAESTGAGASAVFSAGAGAGSAGAGAGSAGAGTASVEVGAAGGRRRSGRLPAGGRLSYTQMTL